MAAGKRIQPGTKLAVDLNENSDADEIRQECFQKQKTFNPHKILSLEVMDYELLLSSLQPANVIPGSGQELTLRTYKEAVGLPYSSITFVLNCIPSGNYMFVFCL